VDVFRTVYFSNKIYGSNFIKQHSDTVMVWNYQNADCSLRKNYCVIYYNFRHTFVPYRPLEAYVCRLCRGGRLPGIKSQTSIHMDSVPWFDVQWRCGLLPIYFGLVSKQISSVFRSWTTRLMSAFERTLKYLVSYCIEYRCEYDAEFLKANSHRHARHGADWTVVSCLVWRTGTEWRKECSP